MLKMSLAFAALLSAGFTLAACGESDVEKAELVTCREVVKLALSSPGTFKVTKSNFDETSEGEAVIARPGQDHGVRNSGSNDLVLLVVMAPRP